MARLIDLSVSIEHMAAGEPQIPGRSPPRVEYLDHMATVGSVEHVLGAPAAALPRGHGWASEFVQLSTHAGTHCDAPWHYSPVTSGGAERSMTIDEVPLDWFYGPGVVLDMTHKRAEEPILPADVESALARAGHRIAPGDIVLFRTDADRLWPTAAYQTDFPGVTKDAALLLIDRGVRVMGIDAYNFDMPFPTQRRLYAETGDNRHLEPCHWPLGFERNYLHIEKLANLHRLPPTGFTFCAFPVKIRAASAGWCRAVAILPDA